jgi:hypothetical protein
MSACVISVYSQIILWDKYVHEVDLGGLLFIVLALDPVFAGSDPAKDEGFLRVIKFRSTSFRWK